MYYFIINFAYQILLGNFMYYTYTLIFNDIYKFFRIFNLYIDQYTL